MMEDNFGWEDDYMDYKSILDKYEMLKSGDSGISVLKEIEFEILIDTFNLESNFHDALEAVDWALHFYPYQKDFLFLKAEILFDCKKISQCLQIIKFLKNENYQNIDLVFFEVEVLLSMDKYDKAAEVIETRLLDVEDSEKIQLLHELVYVYDNNSNHDQLFYTIYRILEIDSENEDALNKLCFYADVCGRNSISIEIHKNILEKNPFNHLAWYNLGVSSRSEKLYEEAISCFEYCIALDADMEEAFGSLAETYIKLKRFDDAINCLLEQLETSTPVEIIYEALGFCYEKKKQYSKAREYYQKALKENWDDEVLEFKIANTFLKEKNFEIAVSKYKRLNSIDKNNYNYINKIALCYMHLGEFEEAATYFELATNLDSKKQPAWMNLIICFIKMDNHYGTEHAIIDAINQFGDTPEFYFLNSAYMWTIKKLKEAKNYFEIAMELNPKKVHILKKWFDDYLQEQIISSILSSYKK